MVSGRWAFCSGITHSDFLFGGCMIDGDESATSERPMPSVVAIPKEDLQILDTWHTLGLRGTGSHDAVADEVFVPSRAHVLVVRRAGPRPPAVPLSGLRLLRALDRAQPRWAMRAERSTSWWHWPRTRSAWARPARSPSARPPTRTVAEAEASLRAARAAYYEAIDAAWQAAQDDQPVSVDLRNGLRLAATHATRTSADVVRSMYDLGGGTAIYDDSPLQRRFRDAHTATAHFQVNAASRELPGRLLLGQPADTATL